MPADRDPDSGLFLALQGAVRHNRNAARTVLWLDPRSLGAGPDQHLQSVWPHSGRSDDAARLWPFPAPRRLAADHGRDDVDADEAQSRTARSDPADDLQLDAVDLHLHAGKFPGRAGDLLGLE